MSVALPFVNSPQNLQRHVRSYAAWLLLIAAPAAYYPRFVKLSAGMETYPQAASCLWHGQMLQVCDQGFTYPPATTRWGKLLPSGPIGTAQWCSARSFC